MYAFRVSSFMAPLGQLQETVRSRVHHMTFPVRTTIRSSNLRSSEECLTTWGSLCCQNNCLIRLAEFALGQVLQLIPPRLRMAVML